MEQNGNLASATEPSLKDVVSAVLDDLPDDPRTPDRIQMLAGTPWTWAVRAYFPGDPDYVGVIVSLD